MPQKFLNFVDGNALLNEPKSENMPKALKVEFRSLSNTDETQMHITKYPLKLHESSLYAALRLEGVVCARVGDIIFLELSEALAVLVGHSLSNRR